MSKFISGAFIFGLGLLAWEGTINLKTAYAQSATGVEINGNKQGGNAVEIISNGTPGQPSVGMDVTTTGNEGQSVTGLRTRLEFQI